MKNRNDLVSMIAESGSFKKQAVMLRAIWRKAKDSDKKTITLRLLDEAIAKEEELEEALSDSNCATLDEIEELYDDEYLCLDMVVEE